MQFQSRIGQYRIANLLIVLDGPILIGPSEHSRSLVLYDHNEIQETAFRPLKLILHVPIVFIKLVIDLIKSFFLKNINRWAHE